MTDKLRIKKPKYFFANGKPYSGPVHTGKGQKKFTGIISTDDAVQVFTEDDFLMMQMPSAKKQLKVNKNNGPTYEALQGPPPGGGGQGVPLP
tara:strand:+ start:1268 stop:1543 length:276 start_codon:yes stop_codon:yes gene_type:complete